MRCKRTLYLFTIAMLFSQGRIMAIRNIIARIVWWIIDFLLIVLLWRRPANRVRFSVSSFDKSRLLHGVLPGLSISINSYKLAYVLGKRTIWQRLSGTLVWSRYLLWSLDGSDHPSLSSAPYPLNLGRRLISLAWWAPGGFEFAQRSFFVKAVRVRCRRW